MKKQEKGLQNCITAIDIAGDPPQFTVITDGRVHDVRAARENIYFKPGATVVMDRAYVDYSWLNALNSGGVTFVTRAKKNMKFKVIESRKTNRIQGYMADQTISLKRLKGKNYEERLRRVSFRDPGKWLVFLNNNFELSYRTICALYKVPRNH